MSQLYRLIGIKRQGHAQMLNRIEEREARDKEVLCQARLARMKYPRVGSRRLYYMASITAVGINQFEDLMSRSGLTVQQLRRRIVTTESRGHKHKYPNLLIEGIKLFDVNELVVCDLQNGSDLYYLFLVTDAYSQRIVGATASHDKRSIQAFKALRQLVELRGLAAMECTLHHSDRGSEYRSDMYIEELKGLKMQISMASNCIENGYAEKRNGTIKNDFLFCSEMAINSICQMRKALKIAVYRYNHEVVQAKLGYCTPVMYEAVIASMPPEQRPVMELYDYTKNKK